jgi:hypothetical protein
LTISHTGTLGIDITGEGGGSYTFSYGYIAYEYALYAAYPGMEFTASYADTHTHLLSNASAPVSSLQTFSLNETKYFAYWEDGFPGGVEDEIDDADDYGWVSLTYTGSGLVIADSATATGGGIIAGTYTQIPEPATILLLGLGGIGAWLLRRNKRPVSEV